MNLWWNLGSDRLEMTKFKKRQVWRKKWQNHDYENDSWEKNGKTHGNKNKMQIACQNKII